MICATEGCDEPATHETRSAGRRVGMCASCLADARLAGRHYGFAVHAFPVVKDEIEVGHEVPKRKV